MNIDIHSHFIPPSAIRAADRGKLWAGISMTRSETGALLGFHESEELDLPEWSARTEGVPARLAWLDAHRLDAQVLSIAPRLQRYTAPREHAIAIARVMNDDLALV